MPGDPGAELQDVLPTIKKEPQLDSLTRYRCADPQIESVVERPPFNPAVARSACRVLSPECAEVCLRGTELRRGRRLQPEPAA